MEKCHVSIEQSSNIRHSCTDVLAAHNNRLKLMLAIMVSVTPLLFYLTLSGIMDYGIVPMLWGDSAHVWYLLAQGIYYLCVIIFSLFFTVPLLSGLFRMASKMEEGRNITLSELFWGFSSRKAYRRTLKISFGLLWKVAILVLAVNITDAFFFSDPSNPILFQMFGAVLMVTEAILWLVVFSYGFPHLYISTQEITGKKKRMPRRPWFRIALCYWLDFLPWLLLSVLTFCILLLADTMPRMLLAYARTCRTYLTSSTEPKEIEK